jgi:predicted nicotinamide N-methyase
MKAGAARAVAADLDPLCQAAVDLNAALNGAVVEFRLGDAIGDPLEGFAVVLAGDVFYERPLSDRALPWFRGLARRGARILAGDPGRLYSPQDVILPPTTSHHPGIESRPVMRTWVLEVVDSCGVYGTWTSSAAAGDRLGRDAHARADGRDGRAGE